MYACIKAMQLQHYIYPISSYLDRAASGERQRGCSCYDKGKRLVPLQQQARRLDPIIN